MSLAAKALWVIERNLDQPARLADLADACGVSRFHLAHAFARAVGMPALTYLRGRRLTLAARALAGGASDILDVALAAGYGSHEAFSRAFRSQFGMTPEALRRAGTTDDITLVEPPATGDSAPGPTQVPRFQTAGEMHFIGLRRRHRLDHARPIIQQWQDFIAEHPLIGPKVQPVPVGIVRGPDDSGTFDYICATEVRPQADLPRGLTRLRLAPQLYAVFAHRGHASALGGTYAAIWDVWMPNAAGYVPVDAPTVERHCGSFDPRTGEGGVDLWVPVARRQPVSR